MVLGATFEAPATVERDGVALVTVRGPLMHHADPFCDSYDAIKGRVSAALEGRPRAVVLAIDSPGGSVSGCFSTVRELRALSASSGVPILAYVEGLAASAGYALACAAERIVVPDAGMVGSIGVMDALVDVHRAEENAGIRVQLVASGERKLDGNPRQPIALAAIDDARARVDGLAELFFALVAEARPITADEARAFEGRMVHGAAAVAAGLADDVGTLDSLVASLAGASIPAGAGRGVSMTDEEKARAALRAIVEGDGDEKAKARARAALAAMDEEEDAPAAEGEPDDTSAPPPKKDEEARASIGGAAAAAAKLGAAASDAERRIAALEAKIEAQDRAALFASRPDLAASVVSALAAMPYAEARRIVDAIPRPAAPRPAASAVVPATRGEGQGDGGAPRLAPEAKRKLDSAMGLVQVRAGVVNEGSRLVLGASVPVGGE